MRRDVSSHRSQDSLSTPVRPKEEPSRSTSPVTSARLTARLPRLTARIAGLGLLLSPSFAADLDLSRLPGAATRTIDFVNDVRPLFEKHCAECHGATKQKGAFRLDDRDSALKGGETYAPAIQPKNSAQSPLIHLVSGLVDDMRMPPKGAPLSAEQIGILRAWIDQGATWPADTTDKPDPIASHWAFRPVQRPALPANVRNDGRTPNPIDAYVGAKLAEKGLALGPEADRVSLIRRLYFVLLGLPPTPEEVQSFLADSQPMAFERLVDRVLADSRYGERWGRHWLDVIRFAESNGFETNRERVNAWRFRDYVIAAFNQDKPYDQFVREQIAGDQLGVDVGTGFLVGGPFDIVKSPDPVLTAQQRADELDDMVSTTGTAFLGLTLGCARCHSHKFDPVSQREYYSMAAVFAGVQHGDRSLPLPAEQRERVDKLDSEIRGLEKSLERFKTPPPSAPTTAKRRPAVDSKDNLEEFPATEARFVRFTIRATNGGEPCIDELEVWAEDRNVALASNGTKPTASGSLQGYDIHKLEHLNDGRPGNGRSWISNEAGKGWVQLEFARPERIQRIRWARDREGNFRDRVALDYVIEVATTPGEWRTVASSADHEPFTTKSDKPAGPTYYFEGIAEADAKQGLAWVTQLEALRKERAAAAQSPGIWAGNFNQPGPTHRLHRGDPMQKRETVAPGTLAVFNPLNLTTNTPEAARRRTLADWIASPENPLTARVAVNRLWQYQFGVGLVDTPNDFGRNGTKPTHPELLDWLAAELVHPTSPAPAWSLKHIQRLIVTSATWRQSSQPSKKALDIDASSRLLWRFPPRRLEAEGIRDSLLAVSGNLDSKAGGPSFFLHNVDRENVYHYHPKEEFGTNDTRRMVYAFKVRMEQDGIFGAFDCPDGSLVIPKRSVSTTPLQALNLFNSRFMLQQSEILTQRLRRDAGEDRRAQIQRAWNLAFNRTATQAELDDATAFANASGMPALCRALLNSNEFLFIP